jgi:hypothetical protein
VAAVTPSHSGMPLATPLRRFSNSRVSSRVGLRLIGETDRGMPVPCQHELFTGLGPTNEIGELRFGFGDRDVDGTNVDYPLVQIERRPPYDLNVRKGWLADVTRRRSRPHHPRL